MNCAYMVLLYRPQHNILLIYVTTCFGPSYEISILQSGNAVGMKKKKG